MLNPYNVELPHPLHTDDVEAAWLDKCSGCGAEVSAIKHDFSLCSQLQNALYRIRQLERAVALLGGEKKG